MQVPKNSNLLSGQVKQSEAVIPLQVWHEGSQLEQPPLYNTFELKQVVHLVGPSPLQVRQETSQEIQAPFTNWLVPVHVKQSETVIPLHV